MKKTLLPPMLLALASLALASCFAFCGCSATVDQSGKDSTGDSALSVSDHPQEEADDSAQKPQEEEAGEQAKQKSPYGKLKKKVAKAIAPYGSTITLAFAPLGKEAAGFSLDGSKKMKSASTIKLLILAELLNQVDAKKLSLKDQVTVKKSDIVGGTGTIQSKGAGSYSLNTLAEYMIIYSDNTATNVILNLIGMDAVNERAKTMKLKKTTIQRLMMDTKAQEKGLENYTSANDLITILSAFYNGTACSEKSCKIAQDYLKGQTDDRGIRQGIPGKVAIGHKTGSLTGVFNDAAIVYGNNAFALVVLTDGPGNARAEAAMKDAAALVYKAAGK